MNFEYICKKFTNIRIYSHPNFSLVRIFEYIRIPIFKYSYSNIKYSAKNIRIFEYIRIFATLYCCIFCSNSYFARANKNSKKKFTLAGAFLVFFLTVSYNPYPFDLSTFMSMCLFFYICSVPLWNGIKKKAGLTQSRFWV